MGISKVDGWLSVVHLGGRLVVEKAGDDRFGHDRQPVLDAGAELVTWGPLDPGSSRASSHQPGAIYRQETWNPT